MAKKPKSTKAPSFNFGANKKASKPRPKSGPRVWKQGTMLERTFGS